MAQVQLQYASSGKVEEEAEDGDANELSALLTATRETSHPN